MLGQLLLLSGNDIPFPEAQVTIHQPTLKEIAYIGEEAFFIGCGFLDFSKKILNEQDKIRLSNYKDFDIFMSIMNDKTNSSIKQTIKATQLVLTLIFPLYEVGVRTNAIVLTRDDKEFFINEKNFDVFKEIIREMFNLNFSKGEDEKYNPSGELSKRIAEKFKQRHAKLLKIKNDILEANGEKMSMNILGRYASILAVGSGKDLNSLMGYTLCQLYDEFQRFQLKLQWDAYVQAKMAGAKDLEEVDNWMIDLRTQDKNKNTKNKK